MADHQGHFRRHRFQGSMRDFYEGHHLRLSDLQATVAAKGANKPLVKEKIDNGYLFVNDRRKSSIDVVPVENSDAKHASDELKLTAINLV